MQALLLGLALWLGAAGPVPEMMDGVYFRRTGHLLEIREGGFVLTSHERIEAHEEKGTLVGGFLRQARESPGRCGLAVVEGRLWAGVLRRDASGRLVGGTCGGALAPLLQSSPYQPPSGWNGPAVDLEWDPGRGRLALRVGAEAFHLEVAPRRDPADSSRLVLLYQPGPERLAAVSRQLPWSEFGGLSGLGLLAVPAGASPERLRQVPGPRHPAFQERGEVLLAPWSVDLGQVGLRPDPRGVQTVAPVRRGQDFPGGLRWGRRPADVEQLWTYQETRRGIRYRWVDWDCQMGHADAPFHHYSFRTRDGRTVSYTSSGGCGGAVPARGPDILPGP